MHTKRKNLLMKRISCSNSTLSTAVTMGLGTGTAMGVAFGAVAVGTGFGAAAGILFGLAAMRRESGSAGAGN